MLALVSGTKGALNENILTRALSTWRALLRLREQIGMSSRVG
jgi:hypothetical protein